MEGVKDEALPRARLSKSPAPDADGLQKELSLELREFCGASHPWASTYRQYRPGPMGVSVEPMLRWKFAELAGIVSQSYQVSPSLSLIYAGLSVLRERDARPNTTLEKTRRKDLRLFCCELSKVV